MKAFLKFRLPTLADSPRIIAGDGKFLVVAPDLSAWGEGTSLDAAYAEYMRYTESQSTPMPAFVASSVNSMAWRRWRNGAILLGAILAIAYAQMAIVLGLPAKAALQAPEYIDKLAATIKSLPQEDKRKLRSALNHLQKAVEEVLQSDTVDASP